MSNTSASEFRKNYHDHIRMDVVPHVPVTQGKLLDIGGGIGGTAAYLKAIGTVEQAGVVDIVAPDSMLSDLDYRYQSDLEKPDTLYNLVKEQGQFDVILALDVLEHLLDPWMMVKNIEAGLKTGGFFVASIPNVRNFTASFPLFFRNRWDYTDSGILDRTHLRFFVKETAISLVTSSGLQLKKVQAAPSGGRKIKLFRRLSLGLFNSFTDRQYIVVAQKL